MATGSLNVKLRALEAKCGLQASQCYWDVRYETQGREADQKSHVLLSIQGFRRFDLQSFQRFDFFCKFGNGLFFTLNIQFGSAELCG